MGTRKLCGVAMAECPPAEHALYKAAQAQWQCLVLAPNSLQLAWLQGGC